MSEVDVKDRLPSDESENKAKEQHRSAYASKVSVSASRAVSVDVRHGKKVKAGANTTTRDIDGEQDWPGNQGAHGKDDDRHLEEAQEEIGIERLVLECIRIRDFQRGSDPIEEARRQCGGSLSSVLN